MQAVLKGKTALVTGSSRGLGLEIARGLARAAATVCLVARDTAALERAADVIAGESPGGAAAVRCYPLDLTQDAQIETTVRRCLEEHRAIDVLVNNAAIQGPIGRFESTYGEAWRHVFQVDLFAPARLIQLLLPGMRERRWGKIVNLSGGGATRSRPYFTAYGAAKCALVRLTETLAEEVKGTGIDVNAVAPGAMNTRMLQEILAAGAERAPGEFETAQAQARSGGVPLEKAAALVVWLASPASDGITGRLLSAVRDNWVGLPAVRDELAQSDVYTLRRILPEDRGWRR